MPCENMYGTHMLFGAFDPDYSFAHTIRFPPGRDITCRETVTMN